MVVSSPCPGSTLVLSGRVSSRSRIDSMMVGKSENERPVAPGPPWNSVSPEKTHAAGCVVEEHPRVNGPACG